MPVDLGRRGGGAPSSHRRSWIEPGGRMIGDAGEDIGEPCLRVDIVEALRSGSGCR